MRLNSFYFILFFPMLPKHCKVSVMQFLSSFFHLFSISQNPIIRKNRNSITIAIIFIISFLVVFLPISLNLQNFWRSF